MKPSNPVQSMPVYASDSAYRKGPSEAQQLAGVVPLDTLPADWWNWLWEQITTRINETVGGLESVYDEILSVLADAEITPSDLQVNQLLSAIKAITQRVGSSGTAGAVKSSSASGKVAIDANGFMSPNGMGVPSSLNTTAKSIVSAVNELLAALNAYKTSNDGAVQALKNGKAPTDHSSADATYGVATTAKYGHVKLSGTYTEDEAGTGVAATQSGLAGAYDALKTMIERAGGLPTTVASDPIVNLTGNGTEAVAGTINITTSGFYYIEMAGGTGGFGGRGGNGGSGGNGGNGGNGYGGSGGSGGTGGYVSLAGASASLAKGGFPRSGIRVDGIYFLPAGSYSYKIGGKGQDGAAGGTGMGGGNGGHDAPASGGGGGGGGGGGSGGFGGFGGTTEFLGNNIYLRAIGGPGGVGMPGGGGGSGGSGASGIPGGGGGGSGGSGGSGGDTGQDGYNCALVVDGVGHPFKSLIPKGPNGRGGGSGGSGGDTGSGGAGGNGAAGGSLASNKSVSFVGFDWSDGSTLGTWHDATSSTENWSINTGYRADYNMTLQPISRYMVEYLSAPGHVPLAVTSTYEVVNPEGYLKIYPLV